MSLLLRHTLSYHLRCVPPVTEHSLPLLSMCLCCCCTTSLANVPVSFPQIRYCAHVTADVPLPLLHTLSHQCRCASPITSYPVPSMQMCLSHYFIPCPINADVPLPLLHTLFHQCRCAYPFTSLSLLLVVPLPLMNSSSHTAHPLPSLNLVYKG